MTRRLAWKFYISFHLCCACLLLSYLLFDLRRKKGEITSARAHRSIPFPRNYQALNLEPRARESRDLAQESSFQILISLPEREKKIPFSHLMCEKVLIYQIPKISTFGHLLSSIMGIKTVIPACRPNKPHQEEYAAYRQPSQ